MACSLPLLALGYLFSITLSGVLCSAQVPAAGPPAEQSSSAGRTRLVSTAQGFLDAFKEGVLHIVLAAHIDLSDVDGDLIIESKGYDFDKPIIELNGTASVRVGILPTPLRAWRLHTAS